jgi:hypothetical protein
LAITSFHMLRLLLASRSTLKLESIPLLHMWELRFASWPSPPSTCWEPNWSLRGQESVSVRHASSKSKEIMKSFASGVLHFPFVFHTITSMA